MLQAYGDSYLVNLITLSTLLLEFVQAFSIAMGFETKGVRNVKKAMAMCDSFLGEGGGRGFANYINRRFKP